MLYVYRVLTDSFCRRYDVSNDVMKTKRDTGLISIDDV